MTHTCHWPDCKAAVPPRLWGCKPHWLMLPRAIRDDILRTYRPGQEVSKTPSAAYIRAAQGARTFAVRYIAMGRPNLFHWSSYWGTWSRVLNCWNDRPTVEVNLTPVNPQWSQSWQETVAPIVFRSHRTQLGDRDALIDALPDEVCVRMVEEIGQDLTTRLLTTDWLALLDMERVKAGRYGGGGLTFAECMKQP